MKPDVGRYALVGACVGGIIGLFKSWEWLLMGGEGIAYGSGLLLGSIFICGAIGYVIGLVRSRNSN